MTMCFVQAAKDLHKLGPKYVLIKGGHLIAAPSDPNRSSSDSQPSPSLSPSQTPSASSPAHESESAAASSTAQDAESAAASSAAQDSESASAQDRDTASDAMHGLDQSVSELSADSSLGEAHLQGQASSQHTDGDRAEQNTAQHNGELGQATLIERTQPRRLNCPQLLALQVCLCVHGMCCMLANLSAYTPALTACAKSL